MKFNSLILYEDEHVLVINKPAGLVVHGDGRGDFETLAGLILKERPEMKDVGEPMQLKIKNEELKIERPGVVHRLDKETSGCLVLAKTQESFEFLKKQFQDHKIEKIYHACTYGSIKNTEGSIEESIGRSKGDIRKWSTGRGARGELREAETEYQVLARIGREEGEGSTEDGTYSYVEAKPKTGRTHQIRVHFKHLNHPIVCDTLYAPNREPALGFERLALHARKISFTLPGGEKKEVEAPFPPDFENVRKLFGLK